MSAPLLRWGLPLRLIHWLMALLIAGLVGLGWVMTHEAYDLGTTFSLYQWHKSYGVLAFLLVLARIAVRWRGGRPPEAGEGGLARRAAHLVHGVFYVLMVALPLTGWLMASASPLSLPTRPFDAFTLPDLVSPDETLFEALRALHAGLAYGLVAVLALHVAGAVKHHVIDRDDTLRRMGF